jgi:hypothetical protein
MAECLGKQCGDSVATAVIVGFMMGHWTEDLVVGVRHRRDHNHHRSLLQSR